jgi:hypothetical protein
MLHSALKMVLGEWRIDVLTTTDVDDVHAFVDGRFDRPC